jgi:hypothetical protein
MAANNQQTDIRTEDRLLIQTVLTQYCHAIDRIQLVELEQVFYDDAIIQNGSGSLTRKQFIDGVAQRHPNVSVAFHMLGNSLIEFIDQQSAFVESYCLAFEHHDNSEQGPVDRTFRVRYGDVFEQRNGQWKISQRRVVIDHEQAIAVKHTALPIFYNEHNAGIRSADDAIMQMRNTLIKST